MQHLIPNRGNYRKLLCYRKAETIYDITYFFTSNFLQSSDRTIDQMIQAARSGKQNIVEGYQAGATSIETELRLINVAKSSLHELLADYEDYLRTRNLHRWESCSEEFICAQQLGSKYNNTEYWMGIIRTRAAEVIANIAIILIYQTDYLLYRYLQTAGSRFVKQGGLHEKLIRERIKAKFVNIKK